MSAEQGQHSGAMKSQPPAKTKRSAGGGFIYLALAAVLVLVLVERFSSVESAVAWGHELPAALAAAAEKNQPVLISFSSAGCTYCKQMEREVIPQEAVLAEIAAFVPVKIDTDADVETAVRYGVESLPTYVVVRPDGTPVAAVSGFVPADRFTRFLQAARGEATQVSQ